MALVDELESKVPVERRSNATDRRRYALCLTAKGKSRVTMIGAAAREHQNAAGCVVRRRAPAIDRVAAANRRTWLTGCLLLSVSQLLPSQAGSQYPIVDRVADKVIQKYQTSGCQQLPQKKQQPPTAQKEATEQKIIAALHNDPQMRKYFLDKVAGPIGNKLFECRLIP